MAGETTAVYPTANAFVDKTAADKFIPEIWSDEIIAAYEKNLKMVPLVKKISMNGKKGDLIHVPMPIRGAASAKAEATAVTIQANLEGELTIPVDQHFEYSRLIEDIVEVQALSSLRQFYTSDAGYALAKQIDDTLFACGTGWGDGTLTLTPGVTGTDWEHSNAWFVDNSSSNALTNYAVDTVTSSDVFVDSAFRHLIQQLDDADVPMDGRCFVIPPVMRNTMMGIERFVSSDFRDVRTVQSGLIGNVYGIDVYVSSNCPVLEDAASNTANTGDTRGAFLFHKDAIVLAEQVGVRSQTQYKQEYLSTLYTADTLYGARDYRPENGVILAVPNNGA